MGKAIYESKGKAGEYAKYACNFYIGCSCGCTYCYNKSGRFAKTLGGDTPTLKKSLKDEEHALEVFEKELMANLPELRKHGLFFSFITDPLIDDCIELTISALMIAMKNGVYCKVLTKMADIDRFINNNFIRNGIWAKPENFKKYVAFGFTLTGHNELEPNASTNAERIEAMCRLHNAGFKTWASIEPVIDFDSSLEMIKQTLDFCDLYKIGLESGKRHDRDHLIKFTLDVDNLTRKIIPKDNNMCDSYEVIKSKIYFKDSLLKQAGISRSELPDNCVNRDYNLFLNK
jgi:DNA repair photolyase